MTIGTGEAFRYIFIHPKKHYFEDTNLGTLFVALSRVKINKWRRRESLFASHEDVLLNDDG